MMNKRINGDPINVQVIVIAMDIEHAVGLDGVGEQQEVGIEELYYKIYIYIYNFL